MKVVCLKVLLVATLTVFSSPGFPKSDQKSAKKGGILRINTQIIEPYSTKDRDGFEDLLAVELYKRLGFSITIYHLPAERGLSNLNRGLDDGILSRVMGLSKTYQNISPIPEMAVEWKFVAFTKRKDVRIKDWNDFKHYHVALVTGWKIFEFNIKKYRSLTKVRNAEQLFRLLEADRVDVVVYALRPGISKISSLSMRNIYPLLPALATKKKYFYIHKKHKKLIPMAVKLLKNIKTDGTYKKLYHKTILTKSFPDKLK